MYWKRKTTPAVLTAFHLSWSKPLETVGEAGGQAEAAVLMRIRNDSDAPAPGVCPILPSAAQLGVNGNFPSLLFGGYRRDFWIVIIILTRNLHDGDYD